MLISAVLAWVVGVCWYFYDLRRGVYRLHPVGTYALMGVGLVLAGTELVRSPGVGVWAAFGAMLPLTGLFLYWMLIYSVTPGGLRVDVGGSLPDFEVADSEGRSFRPAEMKGQACLYVFYRGAW